MVGYGSLAARAWTRSRPRSRGGDYSPATASRAADVYVGAQIGWGMRFGTIEKRPAFALWARSPTARRRSARARSTTRRCRRSEPPQGGGA